MMNIMKKLTGNIVKKQVTGLSQTPPEISALQKRIQETLSQNINELQQYTAAELPKSVSSQQNAIAGLEQLSKNVQSMLK